MLEDLKKALDERMEKAKYLSRKRVGNKWVYKYKKNKLDLNEKPVGSHEEHIRLKNNSKTHDLYYNKYGKEVWVKKGTSEEDANKFIDNQDKKNEETLADLKQRKATAQRERLNKFADDNE